MFSQTSALASVPMPSKFSTFGLALMKIRPTTVRKYVNRRVIDPALFYLAVPGFPFSRFQ